MSGTEATELSLVALQTISKIVEHVGIIDQPTEELVFLALQGIANTVKAVLDARNGKLDPQAALSQITLLHDQLQRDNENARQELRDKFPQP